MKKYQKGQSLVLLLIFVVMAIAITTAATIIIATNSIAVTNLSSGLETERMAESGAEKAITALLRDPTYHGEVFNIDSGTVTVAVTGTTTFTIDSTAVNGNFTKKVEVVANYSNNVLTVASWKEIN